MMAADSEREAGRRAMGALLLAVTTLLLAVPTAADADVFNGRIAFASVRSDPQAKT